MAMAPSMSPPLASSTASASSSRVDWRMSPVSVSPDPRRPDACATSTPASTAKTSTPASVAARRRHERGRRAAHVRARCDSIARMARAARAV